MYRMRILKVISQSDGSATCVVALVLATTFATYLKINFFNQLKSS